MKTVVKRLGLISRLGLVVGLLASGQQAFAQDTLAGTPIDNTASVSFRVAGIQQTAVDSDTASFLVDRRVDFEIRLENLDFTPVTPGVSGVFLPFTLENESNSPLDFTLAELQLAAGQSVRSGTTTAAVMATVSVEVAQNPITVANDPSETPVRGTGNANISNLQPGEEIRIYIFADAPTALVNGDLSGFELSATAAEVGGSALVETTGPDTANVDNVFVNPAVGGNAILTERDAFSVTGADVAATKGDSVVWDPFNLAVDPKAIPGAWVEYEFVLTNSGAEIATAVAIGDTLNLTLVNLRDGSYNGGASNVDLGGGNFCNAGDAVNDSADGCTYDSGTGALSIALPAALAASGGTATVRFQVVIQ